MTKLLANYHNLKIKEDEENSPEYWFSLSQKF